MGWNSQEFLGIPSLVSFPFGISRNFQEFLGIQNQNFLNWEFLGIPRNSKSEFTVKIHTYDSQEFLGIPDYFPRNSQDNPRNSQEFQKLFRKGRESRLSNEQKTKTQENHLLRRIAAYAFQYICLSSSPSCFLSLPVPSLQLF